MILIVDFGSQTAHLIGRRLRQLGITTDYIYPEHAFAAVKKLKPNGIIFSGLSLDKKLVEALELNKNLHPFFVGVQFHPELKSRPLSPHPIFLAFTKAAFKNKVV